MPAVWMTEWSPYVCSTTLPPGPYVVRATRSPVAPAKSNCRRSSVTLPSAS
ncbi:MAG: hypothetical protein HS111_20885 [Kofleriaceae bacterium]|nr:hypothetical protein [Kofleriaceae bacterium]